MSYIYSFLGGRGGSSYLRECLYLVVLQKVRQWDKGMTICYAKIQTIPMGIAACKASALISVLTLWTRIYFIVK